MAAAREHRRRVEADIRSTGLPIHLPAGSAGVKQTTLQHRQALGVLLAWQMTACANEPLVETVREQKDDVCFSLGNLLREGTNSTPGTSRKELAHRSRVVDGKELDADNTEAETSTRFRITRSEW